MKQTLKDIIRISFICGILGVFIFGVRSCFQVYGKGYKWPYEVNVYYQFENDSVEYVYTFEDCIYYNRSVNDVKAKYFSNTGWNNDIIVYRIEEYHRQQREIVIINYTPIKVKTTNITWKCKGRFDN